MIVFSQTILFELLHVTKKFLKFLIQFASLKNTCLMSIDLFLDRNNISENYICPVIITLREIIVLRTSSIIFAILQRRDRSLWNLFPFLSTIHREIGIPCENKSGQWKRLRVNLFDKFCVNTIFARLIYIFVELYFI